MICSFKYWQRNDLEKMIKLLKDCPQDAPYYAHEQELLKNAEARLEAIGC